MPKETSSRPTKRLRLGAAAFSLFGLLATLAPVHALSDHLIISEAVVDVTGAESAGEFVEIYNPTGDTVAIGGWDLAYKTATGGSFSAVATIPAGKTIGPFGYFLIGGDGVSPMPDHVDTSLGFAATGGHIALRNSSNAIIDKLGYGTANDPESAAVAAPLVDQSLERKPGGILNVQGNGQDGDDNFNDFSTRLIPEPQKTTSAREFPDSVAGTIAPAATSLKGISATTNVTVTDADRNNKSYAAETITIKVTSLADPTGVTLIVQETANSASTFTLQASGGPLGLTLGSSDAATRKIKVRASGDTITVSYSDPAPWQTSTATIRFQGVGKVVVNEIVFNPNGADQGNEWIELYNADTISVALDGWTLTNEDAGTVMEMPAPVTLPAGAFLKWNVDAAGTNDTDFSDGSGTIYSGTATTVQFTNTNDQVSLYASTTRNANTIVDFLQYSTTGSISEPSDAQNAIDVGLWPTTDTFVNAAPAPEGAALRLLPDGNDNNRPADWSIDSSPTPNQSNAFVAAPSIPQNLDAVGSIEKILLSWNASTPGSDPIAGYRVYRGTSASSLAEIAFRSTTGYTDTTVSVGTTYWYAVRAEDQNGVKSDTSNIDSAVPQPYVAPGAPGNLVGAGNPFSNDLSWDTAGQGSFPLSTYKIFRSLTSGSYGSPYAEISASKTKYSDTVVSVGTTYFYIVRATDTSGVSGDSSNQVSVVAQGYQPPPPPGSNIQINEIMYDPAGSEPANEWVELYNPTDTPIAIDSWIFADNVGTFRIPESTTIAAKSFFVLGYSATAAGGNVDLIYGATAANISLANTGDTVTLRTDTQIIDQVGYLGSWGGNEPASLSRKFSGSVSQDQTSWGKSIDNGGTPRAANNVDTLPPLITHTPPARTAMNKDMGVQAVITDNIDKEIELGQTTLFYRSVGDTSYSSVVMNRVAITDWNGIVPASAVDTPTLEYYIRAKDASNNFGTFATADTPQQVTVVFIDTKLAINEIMYDPYDTEPANEWAEIRNYGNVAIDLSGWKFGDGEDFFTIPNGTTITAGDYLVFKRSITAAGGAPGIVYGDSSVGIQFDNIIGEITDQVIIKDPSGLIVDEVNYSAEQGAQNLSIDPKNTTLERFDPAIGSNDRANWLYSYQPGGTPGAANGHKFFRNFNMSTTLINPTAGDTVRFTFDLIVDTKTFVKIEIYSETNLLLHTINLDTAVDSGTYAYSYNWNGKNAPGANLLGILLIEPVATTADGRISRLKVDDKTAFLPRNGIFRAGNHNQGTQTYFEHILSKPMSVTHLLRKIITGFEGPNTRYIWNEVPCPSGKIYIPWDGRDDSGIPMTYTTLPLISARPFSGNILISRQPLQSLATEFRPRTTFDPRTDSQIVLFDLGDTAFVTVRVRKSSDGSLIKTVVSDAIRYPGLNEVSWDGRDMTSAFVDDGLYIIEVHATSLVGREQVKEFGEVYARRDF